MKASRLALVGAGVGALVAARFWLMSPGGSPGSPATAPPGNAPTSTATGPAANAADIAACLAAAAALPRTTSPSGYLAARRVIVGPARTVEPSVSDDISDLTPAALRAGLVIGRTISPVIGCSVEVVDILPRTANGRTVTEDPPPATARFVSIVAPAGTPTVWPAGPPAPTGWTPTSSSVCDWTNCLPSIGHGSGTAPLGETTTTAALARLVLQSATLPPLSAGAPPTPAAPPIVVQSICEPTPPPPVATSAAVGAAIGSKAADTLPGVAQPTPTPTSTVPAPPPAQDVTIYPARDQFFVRDFDGFEIEVQYGTPGPPPACGQATSTVPDEVTVDIDVTGRLDAFYGIDAHLSKTIRRGQAIYRPVRATMLFPMWQVGVYSPQVKAYTEDWIFGINVAITVRKYGKVVKQQAFNAYRYRDTADAAHDDGEITLEPTLGDGPNGVTRRRRLRIDVPKGSELSLAVQSTTVADGLTIEPHGGGNSATDLDWVFDPGTTRRREKMERGVIVKHKASGNVVGTLTAAGDRVPPQTIDLREADLISLLEDLATRSTPRHHVQTAMLSEPELSLFSAPAGRRGSTPPPKSAPAFAAIVLDKVRRHFAALSHGVQFGPPSDPANNHYINWKTLDNGKVDNAKNLWGERFPGIAELTKTDVSTAGFTPADGDGLPGIDNLVDEGDRANWSGPEFSFRMASAMNRSMVSESRIFVDNVLETSMQGILNATLSESTWAIAKVVSHETGHALSLTHTSQWECCTGQDEYQELTVSGSPTDPYVIGFNGVETPALLVSSNAAEIQMYLRDLSTIAGPSVKVTDKTPGSGKYIIQFYRALAATDVPEIIPRPLHNSHAVVGAITTTEGCGQAKLRKTYNDKLPELIVMPGGGGTTVKGDLCASSMGPAEHEPSSAGHGAHDLMIGGWVDYFGQTKFLPTMSLAALKVSLHLDYTTDDMLNLQYLKRQHFRIGELGENKRHTKGALKFWDSSAQDPQDPGDPVDEFVPPFRPLVFLVEDTRVVTLDLGGVELSQDPAPAVLRTVSVRNPNDRPTTVHAVRTWPERGALVAELDGEATIAPGEARALRVTYRPGAPGAFDGRIAVDTDAGPAVIDVSAGVTAPGGYVLVEAANTNLGGLQLSQQALRRGFATVRNAGGAPVTITSAAVTGRHARSFVLSGAWAAVSSMRPVRLAPGQSMPLDLLFRPVDEGLLPAEIAITSSASAEPIRLAVTGTGFVGVPAWRSSRQFVAIVDPLGRIPDQRAVWEPGRPLAISVPPLHGLDVVVFDPATGLVGHTDVATHLAPPVMAASTAPDTDADGLPDDIERALGSSLTSRDTNGNGITDFDELAATGVAAPGPSTLGPRIAEYRAWLKRLIEPLAADLERGFEGGQYREENGAFVWEETGGTSWNFQTAAEGALASLGGRLTSRSDKLVEAAVDIAGRPTTVTMAQGVKGITVRIRPR